MRFDINDGRAHLDAGTGVRHRPNYRNYYGHPFVEEALEVAGAAKASLYGVHIYLLIEEEGQQDGLYFDYEPRVKEGSGALKNESFGLERAFKGEGWNTTAKVDGRFRFDDSKWAFGVVGHNILGDNLPADLDADYDREHRYPDE